MQGSTNAGSGRSGGVLPAWWIEERTLVAGERIEQYAPIEYRQYRFEDRMEGQVIEGIAAATVTATMGGDYMAVVNATDPYLYIYRKVDGVYTLLTNPSDLPPATKFTDARLSPDGQYFVVTAAVSPYAFIYKMDGDTMTRLYPDVPLSAAAYKDGSVFSKDNSNLVIRNEKAPYINVYRLENDTLTKLAWSTNVNGGTGYDTWFTPDGQYLLMKASNVWRKTEAGEFEKIDYGTFFDGDLFPTIASAHFYISSTGEYIACSWVTGDTISVPYSIYQYKEDGSGYRQIIDFTDVMGKTAGYPIIPMDIRWVMRWNTSSTAFVMYKYYGDGIWARHPADPPELMPDSGETIVMLMSPDENTLYAFTKDTAKPLIVYNMGTYAMALNMRDALQCKRMALNPYVYYGMGIALTAAEPGQEFLAGMFTPINETVGEETI